jgi:UDP-glucose:(heptosyl)LPS alpha-1,3-glucosyltransferase
MFVSNNFRLKGLQYLIPAIYHLKNLKPKTPFSLLVIGKDRPDPFIKLARGIGVGERLIFAGGIREKMECWYGASDCLVHPTLFDPFSNVCLEALASGLPVITSKYNGAMEIMNHGEEGFVLSDPSSKEEIAIRMEAFLERDFLHQASRKARNLAEAYSIERNAMEVIDLYRDVISHKVKEAK